MRVFSVPVSAPFLRTVIAALVDGRLVDGFEARTHPERLAQATLYLPTRRAGRMAREIFLDELKTDAVLLPRIVALGDIDEDELAFAEDVEQYGGDGAARHSAEARRTRAPADAGESGRGLGETSGIGAAGGRRPGLDAGAGRRSGAADGRHGHPRRRLGSAGRAGAGPTRPILAALARIPADRATGMAGTSAGNPEDRTGGAARPPDRGGSQAPDRASRRSGDRGGLDRLDAGDREIPARRRALPQGAVVLPGLDTDLDEEAWQIDRRRQGRAGQIHHAAGVEPSAIRDARAAGSIRHQAQRRRNPRHSRRRTDATCWYPRRCGRRTRPRNGIGGWPSPTSPRRSRAA